MKTLTLTFDKSTIKDDLPPQFKETSAIEISTKMISNLILQSSPQGLDEKSRRILYKLWDIFEKAVAENQESVELEDEYFGLIKQAKHKVTFNPDRLSRKIEELIEAVKDR